MFPAHCWSGVPASATFHASCAILAGVIQRRCKLLPAWDHKPGTASLGLLVALPQHVTDLPCHDVSGTHVTCGHVYLVRGTMLEGVIGRTWLHQQAPDLVEHAKPWFSSRRSTYAMARTLCDVDNDKVAQCNRLTCPWFIPHSL